MSRTQNTFVDYTNLGDTGTNTAGAIQPIADGEAGSAATFNRSPQNLRSRTEIQRDIVEDLLYYRDVAPRYLIDLSGGGLLSWEVGGVGRVNNTTALSLRPFVGPRTDVKGTLYIGTAASNQLRYTVAATAYAADGMNAITIEHRSVTGTVTPVVTISAGPVYHILVLFDAANTGHSAGVVQPLVSSAIAGVGALASKLVVSTSAVPAVAILATSGRVPLNVRTHTGGLSGTASADLEEHTLAAGALDTFTTTNPLQEGDLLAVRYDYVAEDAGTGGRAQSSVARGSADIAANLFLAQAHPEWLPGCVPLCKVVHGRLVWVDGTILASGTSMAPGGTYASYISVSAFQGVPTQVVNGGIDNAGDPVLQDVLVSIDERLSQSRYATWTVTDGTNSSGGHYNTASGVSNAVAAATNGGDIVVRRGVYTAGLPAITITSGGLKLRGETHDGTLTSRTRVTAAANTTVNSDVSLENLAYLRTGAFSTSLTRNVALRRVALQAGALNLAGAGYSARLDDVTLLNSVSTGNHGEGAIELNTTNVHVTNSRFTGPDPLSTGTKSAVWQGATCTEALYENCTFTSTKAGCLPFSFESTSGLTTFVNCTFRLQGSASSYVIDFEGLSLGGTVRYVGCRFINEDGFAVVRARPTTGTVIFENCSMHANGSPNGIAVAFQCVAVLAPLTAAKVVVKNCSATVTEDDFTGILRSLVRVGGSETGACAGTLQVDGFDVVLAGASATLPASACVLLQGNAKCLYKGVTVDVAGKRAPAVTNAIVDGGPGYVFAGFGDAGPRLQLRNFAVYNADGPSVSATATCVTGWLYLLRCVLNGFAMTTVTTPTTNTFQCKTIDLQGSELSDGVVYGFKHTGSEPPISLLGANGRQAALVDCTLLTPTGLSGGMATDFIIVRADGGIVQRLTYRYQTLGAGTGRVFGLYSTVSGMPCVIEDNNIVIEASVGFLFSNDSGINLSVRNNHVATELAAGIFLEIAATYGGMQLTGNRFITDGATAAFCTPDPTTVVATAVTAVSNNVFATSWATPV